MPGAICRDASGNRKFFAARVFAIIKISRVKPTREIARAARNSRGNYTLNSRCYLRANGHTPTTLWGKRRYVTPALFLAIRHISRLNQGNYGAKRSKRPASLVRSHISRAATPFDIGAACELKTFDKETRDEIFTSFRGRRNEQGSREGVLWAAN